MTSTKAKPKGRPVRVRSERPLLLQLLAEQGRITEPQAQEVVDYQGKTGLEIERALTHNGILGFGEIASLYSGYFRLPTTDLVEVTTDEALAALGEDLAANPEHPWSKLLPDTFCWEHMLVPLEVGPERVLLASARPDEGSLVADLRVLLGRRVDLVIAPLDQIERIQGVLFGERDSLKEIVAQAADVGIEGCKVADSFLDLDAKLDEAEETRIVQLVNQILKDAYRSRASDIHVEPGEKAVTIRCRVDGRLQEMSPVPRYLFQPLVSRLKIVSRLDIAEKRVPQDGSFSIRVDGNVLDVRVSSLPTVWGEKVVMRLLDKSKVSLDFGKLGFDPTQRQDLLTGAQAHNGLCFVTGPTGSGKSTTLYTLLNSLLDVTKNVMTAEDPVEYKFSGISQVHVRQSVGLTFASTLRAFLRQDPDVIMVGEVRDRETAEICIRASLTGHMVLSTLHTNSALDSIARLVDMGVEPFLLAATLRVLEAQRLVRRLCASCKVEAEVEPAIAEVFGFAPGTRVFRPGRCDACRGQGYSGRVGVYEVIPIHGDLSAEIQRGGDILRMREVVRSMGRGTLAASGRQKVLEGVTSVEEVYQFVAEERSSAVSPAPGHQAATA